MIEIGSTTDNVTLVQTPSKFAVTVNDLDAYAERNAAGTLVRDRIAVKRKIQIEYPALTQAQLASLLTAVSSQFFWVSYPDPLLGQTTKQFYTSDRTAPALHVDAGGAVLWSGLTMNWIER